MRFFDLTAAALITLGTVSAAGPVFLFTTFSTSSTAVRDELIASMDNVSRWSCANEPGVSKHAIFIPRGGSDATTAYSIEQYDDEAALQKHLATEIMTNLHNSTTWSKITTSSVQNFTVINSTSSSFFRSDQFALVSDPYVVIQNLTYSNTGGMRHVIEHQEEAIEYASKSENGTLALGLYTDPTNNKRLWTLGAYESEMYKRDVHDKSGMAEELEEHTGGMRTSRREILLAKKGGFLFKGAGGCV
ncbi:hypothetical protein V8F06_012880 [Rhypophila decipiens]